MLSDDELRLAVRSQLPPEIFKRSPWRMAYAVLLLAIICTCGWIAMHSRWYLAVPLSLAAGHTWGILMFFGHEVAHGAVVSSRRLQDVVLYLCSSIFCLSPKLWRVWHNGVHHGHANEPDRERCLRRIHEP